MMVLCDWDKQAFGAVMCLVHPARRLIHTPIQVRCGTPRCDPEKEQSVDALSPVNQKTESAG